MKIAIGTTSELKIRALKNALVAIGVDAEVLFCKADSKIAAQPFGYDEMILGAKNRAMHCKKEFEPDISIAVENGLVSIGDNYFDIACIYAVSKENEESISFSSGYFVPEWIIKEIKENNTEFGFITQKLAGDADKDPLKYFSGGIIKREDVLSQAIAVALVKLFNKNKYTQPN